MSIAEILTEDADRLKGERDGLRVELEATRDRERQLDGKVRALQYQLAQATGRGAQAVQAEETASVFPPESVWEAVARAEEFFADDLYVLPSALDAAEARQYRDPDDVLRALSAMASLTRKRQTGPLGHGLKEELQPFDYASGLSGTTPKKLLSQYRFHHQGRDWDCHEHLRLGGGGYDPAGCARIYFNSRDDDTGRIVIGHVGRHLDVLTTT